MEERIIQYNTEAREKIKAGVDKLANAVKVTLGPKGRNVAYKAEDGTIKITKDGVTVAKHVFLNDPMESIGAEVVKETSALTNKLVGDATTTSTVLAQAIFNEGYEVLKTGYNPIRLKEEMEAASELIVSEIKKVSEQY